MAAHSSILVGKTNGQRSLMDPQSHKELNSTELTEHAQWGERNVKIHTKKSSYRVTHERVKVTELLE